MIYNKLYNLPNQTSQPGTLENIKARFHHHKASKNIANFYACWDLMEITTLSNLLALAMEISGLDFADDATNVNETDFNKLVDDIFDTISTLQRWTMKGMGRCYLLSDTCYLILAIRYLLSDTILSDISLYKL